MALSSTLVWEIRTTGNSANGGAFRIGSGGTDYSQQDAAQITYTDLAVDASDNKKVTSSANPFTSAHVGNVINISSTSPWTAGYYEIISVASGVATLDRSPAATSSTGGAGKLGGAADHPVTIAGTVVASNVVWVKTGTYTISTPGANFSAALAVPTNSAPLSRLSGYGTTRGDSGRALFASDGFFGTVLTVGAGWYVSNLEVNTNNSRIGILTGQYGNVYNCKIYGATVYGINIGNSNCVSVGNEIYGCSGTAALSHGGSSICWGNYVHDNTTVGIAVTFSSVVSRNLVINNTGATSDGIGITSAFTSTVVTHNTVHGNGRHGLNHTTATQYIAHPIQSNIFSMNGGYGAVFASAAGIPAMPMSDGNAYYRNSSGPRSNGSDTTVNPQNSSGAYTNTLDQILTDNPFVNSGQGDFRLNTLPNGGALCMAHGAPVSVPGISSSTNFDIGLYQAQTIIRNVGINGGYNS